MKRVQVAVVGAGPAGLGAATAAARAGAEVILLDEDDAPGGSLRDRLPLRSDHEDPALPLPPLAELVADARGAGVDLRPTSVVWGVFDDNVLAVATDAASYELVPGCLIVATGSTDLALPVPGATLPGVLSARAVQILLHRHRILPGRRAAVLGVGREAAEVARVLRLAGAELAVAHPAREPATIAIVGASAVEAIEVDGERVAVDLVVVALGRQPDAALPLLAGRSMAWLPALGGWVPALDDRLRSDDPRLLCAGDAAGICAPEVALAEGRYAGICAAVGLGLVDAATLAAARADYAAAVPARLAARRAATAIYAQPDEWEPA